MQLAKQQLEASDAVNEWYHNSENQVFRLMGYAGTGKTTVANAIVERLGRNVRSFFAAYTGKAAHVLRQKGCDASTIHSLTYKLRTVKKGKPEFVLNDEDSPLLHCDLLIVDEVSMVGEEMGKDLESFGMKILVLGDPMQLPPIKGAGYFTEGQPDYLLTEIHRQAGDNPIIKLATMIRNGEMPMEGQYGESAVQTGMTKELVMGADQLLVGKNDTRKESNFRARSLRGFESQLPQKGDKLVCLRNNRREGFMNGTVWFVTEANTEYKGPEDDFFPPSYICDLRSEDGEDVKGVQMHKEIFLGEELPYYIARRSNEFDFGYALTCHKAQGSQWDHVVIYDESKVFRDTRWRWLYTAVTRAAKRVNICRPT